MPHRKTCKRYNTPGDAHALTFSCFRRQPFLSKDGSRRWLMEAIDRARVKLRFHVWAYVIMPEHAHLLLWPTQPEYDISEILKSIKQSVAKRAVIFVRREAPQFLVRMEDRQPSGEVHYRFWQRGGGYDRNVFEPMTVFDRSSTFTIIRFVVGFVLGLRIGTGRVPRITPESGSGSCGWIAIRCRRSWRDDVGTLRHAHAKPWAWHPSQESGVRQILTFAPPSSSSTSYGFHPRGSAGRRGLWRIAPAAGRAGRRGPPRGGAWAGAGCRGAG